MAVDKFKFVSPGVFIDEIDESGIPSLPERMGPWLLVVSQEDQVTDQLKLTLLKSSQKSLAILNLVTPLEIFSAQAT